LTPTTENEIVRHILPREIGRIGLFVAFLSACGAIASQSARAAPAHAARVGSESGLVYLSAGAEVDVYSLADMLANSNPQPVDRITGFGNADSVAVDKSGNLYVADQLINQVYEFKPGKHQPFKRLRIGLNAPVDVAVGDDGSVYVANIAKGTNGSVVVFAPGSHEPTLRIMDFDGASPTALCLDAQNELYIGYSTANGVGAVKKYAPGAKKGTSLGLQFAPTPLGIVVDQSGNVVLAGYTIIQLGSFGTSVWYEVAYLAGNTDPQLPSGTPSAGQMALTQDESAIVVAGSTVFSYLYGPSIQFAPVGLLSKSTTGVAISPPDPG
jgi:hypothetical protein